MILVFASAIIVGFALTSAVRNAQAAYGVIHGFAEGGSWRNISGNIDTPYPSMANWSHKHYMVYFSDGLTPFTAGAGIFVFKNASTDPIVTCYLRLFFNDNPADNANVTTCSPSPSGQIAVKVEQTTNGDYTFKGTSGAYTYTYTYTKSKVAHPTYFGAVSTGNVDNLSMYSYLYNLKMLDWSGNVRDLSTIANYKCYVDSGYKYDDQNRNAYLSGPPAVTLQDCGLQQDQYRPHAEWD